MLRTIKSYGLLAEGDRVMVAVSGGKDSYTLLDLLWYAKHRAPFAFDVVAVHLDQGQPGYDGEPLRRLEAIGLAHRRGLEREAALRRMSSVSSWLPDSGYDVDELDELSNAVLDLVLASRQSCEAGIPPYAIAAHTDLPGKLRKL
mgnify:CR=1 FL=1